MPTWWVACEFSHVYSLWISWQGMRLSYALVFHMLKHVSAKFDKLWASSVFSQRDYTWCCKKKLKSSHRTHLFKFLNEKRFFEHSFGAKYELKVGRFQFCNCLFWNGKQLIIWFPSLFVHNLYFICLIKLLSFSFIFSSSFFHYFQFTSIVVRGVLIPNFMKTPPPPLFFFKFCPICLTRNSTLLLFLLPCFFH